MVITHRTVVRLPAHPFTARRQDRATLSGRRLVRLPISPVIVARRALTTAVTSKVTRSALEAIPAEPRQWPWTLASLTLIVLLVAACAL